MSPYLLALVLGVKFGASSCTSPVGTYVWEVEYVGHAPETYTSTDGKLEFTPVPYRVWRIRHNFDGGPMSDWSQWFPTERIAGDADGDCAVGAPDVNAVGMNWAQRCPF